MTAQRKIAQIKDRARRFKGEQGLDEHELDVILCFDPPGHDRSARVDPELSFIRIAPTPRVISKNTKAIDVDDTKGAIALVAHTYEVCEVSRLENKEEEIRSALYFLVVPRGEEVQPDAVPRMTRYKIIGEIALEETQWKFTLQEIK
jgi:hypothetical protein